MRNVGKAQRGLLKIFLGAAPGVGKTYQMLRVAQSRRRDGVDVVIGLIETHGRQDTEEQLRGLGVIPRRAIEYKEHVFEEMDIDALLERRRASSSSTSWRTATCQDLETPSAFSMSRS